MAMPEVYLALKTGSIDGQENPLTIMNAAKYYEVTEQVVLTAHLVQPVFYALRKQTWDGALGRRRRRSCRRRPTPRPRRTTRLGSPTRSRSPSGSRRKGLTVTTVDLKPFLDNADKVYARVRLRQGLEQGPDGAGRRRRSESTPNDRSRCLASLAKAAEAASALAFAAMFVLFLAGIFARYVLGKPLAWSDELIMVIFLWVVFLTEAFVITEREQVTFDGVYDLVGERARRIILAVGARSRSARCS